MRSKRLQAALVVLHHRHGDVEFNLDRHRLWLHKARAAGARFVGFPEFALTGWVDSPTLALPLHAEPIRQIEAWARQERLFIATGFVERRGRYLYNSCLLAGPAGRIGLMRKVNLIPRETQTYRRGRELPVFDVAGCRLGVAICADATRFEMFHLLSLRGAEVIFAPHCNTLGRYGGNADGWVRWRLERWPLFARDARVAVLGVNNAGNGQSKYCGGALVMDADGKVTAKLAGRTNREGMLVAELDLQAVRRLRRTDFAGHRFPARIIYNRRDGWEVGV